MSEEIVANFELDNTELTADMELSDSQIEADFVVYGGGTVWGNIDGQIANQTDLKNELDGLSQAIENEATARTNKDTLLDNDISTINGKINTINGTLDGLGDIVTHNVSEFATSEQGSLADSSIQPSDNISELTNDAGYITSASLPTVNNAKITIQKNGTEIESFNLNQSTNETINITVPTQASDINALPSSTKYGKSIDLSLDTTDYKMTISLKDQDGNVLNSKVVDFPLESVVVSGAYDDNTKKVVLTLQNGSTVDFSVADLVAGLQAEITSSNKLDSDLVDDTNQTNKFVTATDISNWNGKQDSIADLSDIRDGAGAGATAVQPEDLSTVATTGSYTDLLNKPTIPSAQIQSDWNQADNTKLDYIKNKPTIPTVPSNVSAFTNDSGYITSSALSGYATETWVTNKGYITGIDSSDVTTALGYTPYDSSNPNGYTSNVGTVTSVNNNLPDSNGNVTISGVTVDQTYDGTSANAQSGVAIEGELGSYAKTSSLSTVATSGNYNDLSNKPTIPTVNNGTLTIQKNGSTVKTFTANQSSNVTCNITVPTNTNELTNGAGFISGITSSDVTTALGYTPYDSSNPNGYTSNVGTVTSVNGESPVNGNVSLSIPTVNQTFDGTSANAESGVSILGLLEAIYPVGAIFIGTTSTCPMSALFGTWELVAQDRVLQGSSTNHSAGTTIAAGLPNITGLTNFNTTYTNKGYSPITESSTATGSLYLQQKSTKTTTATVASSTYTTYDLGFNANNSSTIYGNGNSTVQPPAYVVNVWRRTA